MAKRARVMTGYYYPWTNDAGIYFARDKGYFAQAGIDAEICLFDAGHGDTLRYLADGDVDFGIFPANRLLVLRESEPNVIAVAAINQCGLETIQTVKGKGVNTPADLSGKAIALNATSRGLAMVKHIVKAGGGDPDSLVFFDSGPGEIPALEIKKASEYAAAFGSYWAWDILLDESLPQEERIVWPVDKIGAPRYHSYLLGVNAKHAERDPEYVKNFVRALGRGYRETAADPLAAAPLFRTYTPYLPARVIEKSLPLIAGTWLLNGVWGTIREDYMKEYASWLFENGILRSRETWKDACTGVFLEDGKE
jgi:NitT/TauT family transport system substrate-binding protein